MKRFVRRFFFAITLFPLFFSCKGANKIDISDEKKEKEAFIITFDVTDKKFLKQRIDILDSQINSIVYSLYGLSEEEIEIVERWQ